MVSTRGLFAAKKSLEGVARERREVVAQRHALTIETAAVANATLSIEHHQGRRGTHLERESFDLSARERGFDLGRLYSVISARKKNQPKKGVTFTFTFTLTAEPLVRRLVALVPPRRRHLTRFHGVYAPHAALRPVVTQPVESPRAQVAPAPTVKKRKRHLEWATLHQRTWGTDVLRCPCGGRRSLRSLHSPRKQAEARLLELGDALPARLLPPAAAPPLSLAG